MNVTLLLETAASLVPRRVAVTDEGGSMSYAEMLKRARSWGRWIASVASKAPVVYVGQAQRGFVEILFGSAYADSPFVPLNYRASARELGRLIRICEPALIVAEDRYVTLAASASGVDGPRVIGPDFDIPTGADDSEIPLDGSRPALQLFTSGTTSDPKLAVLTHANLTEYVLNTVEAGSAEEKESSLVATPPYHIAAVANVLTNVFRCRRLVLLSRFDPIAWLETVRSEGVTHAMVVPTMLVRILNALEEHPELAPSSLRNLAYGGSAMPEGLVERALSELPRHVGLVNAFGLTETSSTVALLGPEDHRIAYESADPKIRARLRSVGRPVPGVEIKICHGQRDCAAGEEGEIWIRGSQVSVGYRSGRSRMDADGWLHTGDRGRVEADGYLYVLGREDDVIIRGGEKISPEEVEDVLIRHGGIEEAAVVGLPDPEWGQIVAALLVGDQTASDNELQDWVRMNLAGYKAPTKVRWVERLPRNELGKVVRSEARRLFDAG